MDPSTINHEGEFLSTLGEDLSSRRRKELAETEKDFFLFYNKLVAAKCKLHESLDKMQNNQKTF